MKSRAACVAVDVLMTVTLPLLMAYSLIGETFHEIVGIVMFVLFILHHAMHPSWWRNLFRGNCSAYRIFHTLVNLSLCAIMIFLPLSGVIISRHLFSFLPTTGFSFMARKAHLLLAYWGYILMSLHAGLHMDAMLTKKRNWMRYAVTAVSLYGIYAFLRRDIPAYMFLRTQFVFFNFSEPRIFFFMDYLAIMILFTAIGYQIGKQLRSI